MYRFIILLLLSSILLGCKKSVKVTCCDADPYETAFAGGKALVPNVFTPNGDGVNDTFGPITEGVSSFEMTIVNTREKVLYETQSSVKWNGIVGGEMFNGIVGWTIILRTDKGDIITLFGQVCVLNDTDDLCPDSIDNCAFENQVGNAGFDLELPNNESLCIE